MKAPKITMRSDGRPRGGYAGTPGHGPAGETCGSCAWFQVVRYQKTYFKCALTETASAASDIRKSAPSCQMWKRPAVVGGCT